MKKEKRKKYIFSLFLQLLFIFILCFIFIFSTVYADNPKEHVIPLIDIELLDLYVKFGIGEINLESGEGDVFKGNFQYGNGILEPKIQYNTLESKGVLMLSQGIRKDINLLFPLQNTWSIELPENVPMRINVNSATCNGNMDLSGLQVKELSLLSGVSNLSIFFNRLNTVVLDKINIKTGASKLEMNGLANANFDRMEFSGGAGKYIFDFSGVLKNKSKIKINVAAAKVILKIPSFYGTRIKVPKNPTSSLKIKDFMQINDQVYINQLYGKMNEEIDIEINGMLLDIEIITLFGV